MIKIGSSDCSFPVSKIYVGTDVVYEDINPYDYGDGSLNNVIGGYTSLYINGVLSVNPQSRTYNYGNYLVTASQGEPYNVNDNNPIIITIYNNVEVNEWGDNKKQNIYSGFNYYRLTVDATLEDKTCIVYIRGGGGTTSNNVGKFLFKCDDYNDGLTLSQMVALGIIKPLVIIFACGNSTNYIYTDILNSYDDPNYVSVTKSYSEPGIIFMVNKGHSISKFGMYSTRDFNTYYDGLDYMVAPTEYARITLNSY